MGLRKFTRSIMNRQVASTVSEARVRKESNTLETKETQIFATRDKKVQTEPEIHADSSENKFQQKRYNESVLDQETSDFITQAETTEIVDALLLTSKAEELFHSKEINGTQKTNLIFTRRFVHEMNSSISLQMKLRRGLEKSNRYWARLVDISAQIKRDEAKDTMRYISCEKHEHNVELFRNLRNQMTMIARKRERLEASMKFWRADLETRRKSLENTWIGLLSSHELLQIVKENFESDNESFSETESTIEEYQEDIVGDALQSTSDYSLLNESEEINKAAYVEFQQIELKMRALRTKLDNWNTTYLDELARYEHAVGEKNCDVFRSDFDKILLQAARKVTADLIRAEEVYDDAKSRMHNLEILAEGAEQRSNFVDDINDGYRVSFENDMIASADSALIYAWMENDTSGDIDLSYDRYWDALTVEIGESISVVAQDPERRWIDRWCAQCEETKLEMLYSRLFSTETDGAELQSDEREKQLRSRALSCSF